MQGEAILIGRRQHQGKPFLLGQFATKETLRGSEQTAGMIQPSFGRTQRFLNF